MRPTLRRALVAVPLLALALASCAPEKSYTFPDVTIDATVNQDGSLSIVERRTYDFRGQFRFAFFTVEHKRFDDVVEFYVAENGRRLREGPPETPGSVVLEDNVLEGPGGFKFKATWWFVARDEVRTFEIGYRVLCAVDVYRDTAHLLWKFVGEGWTVPTERATIRLRLPGRARQVPERPSSCFPSVPDGTPGYVPKTTPPEIATTPLATGDVRAWGHGPLHGDVRIPEPNEVVLAIRDLAPAAFVEGSVLFPREVVPYMSESPEAGLDRVLGEERELAEQANRERRAARAVLERQERIRRIAYTGLAGLPAVLLLLVLLARLRDRVPGVPRYLQEPPEPRLHPAVLATEWSRWRRRSGVANAFRAHLLNLVNRRDIELVPLGTVSEARDYELRLRRRPTGDETDEQFGKFLFDGSDRLRLKSLRPNAGQKKALRAWWKEIGKAARHGSSRPRLSVLLPFFLWFLSPYWTIPLAVTNHLSPLFPIGVFAVSFALWIAARRIVPRRADRETHERLMRWAAFRRYLKRFSSLTDAPTAAIVVWERFLVHAVALDVADRVEKQVRALLPEAHLPSAWPGGTPGPDALAQFRSLSSLPVRSVASAALVAPSTGGGSSRSSGSSWSSSSGGGGGFSSGGGGGGGGTGGGAG